MFGQDLAQTLSDVQKYVVKYGQPEIVPYFTAILWQENEDGTITLTHIRFIADKEDPDQFVALLENKYMDMSEVSKFKPGEKDKIIAYFRTLYQSRINLEYMGVATELNICLHLPLFDVTVCEQVTRCIELIGETTLNFGIDIIGYAADLADLFPDIRKDDEKTHAPTADDVTEKIADLRRNDTNISHFIIVSNCQERGLSLNFTQELFAAFLSEFALLCIENYEGNERGLFKAAPYESDLITIGMSVLRFDRFYFVNYLLHKSYLYAMEKEGITGSTDTDVESIKFVLNKTQDILRDKINLFSSFYQTEIQSRLDKQDTHNIISREIERILDERIKQTERECESFLQERSLYGKNFTLPLKRAVFSALLSKNDEVLAGTLFSEDTLMLEDLNSEAIDVFVDANNSLLDKEETKDEAVLSSDYNNVESQWKAIKKLRIESLQLNAEIHRHEEEIERLSKTIEHREEVGKEYIKQDGWIDDEGNFYHLLPDVELKPLDAEYYKPHPVKSSKIDLRDGFTEIRNQKCQGSCAAHSVLSIFEYILKSNKAEKTDLSESFQYYNARVLGGGDDAYKDEGSCIYYNIMSLGKYGICSEDVCPYDPAVLLTPDNPPGELAYEDAKSRRAEKSLNLNLNVDDIKSALEDGYPVEFAAKLYDSFGSSYKGIVSMPTKEEIDNAAKDNRNRGHAMVICGYDDDEQLFIVRNSWGDGFGDKGYCYFPYSYITDASLTRKLGYIITEVTVYKAHGIVRRKGVNFDGEDAQLQVNVLKNRLANKKRILETKTRVLAELNGEYNELKNNILDSSNYTMLKEATKKRLQIEIDALQKIWEDTEQHKQEELSLCRKKTVKTALPVSAIAILLCIVCFVFALNILGLTVIALCIFGMNMYLRHRNRRYKNLKDECTEKCDSVFKKKANRLTELKNSDLRIDTAHQILLRYKTLKMNLDDKYTFLVAFIDYLNALYKTTQEESKMSPKDNVSFVSSLIHNGQLDIYFDGNKDTITHNIFLSDIFNQHDIDWRTSVNETINRYEQNMKQIFIAELKSQIQGFNVFAYLSDTKNFPFLKNADFNGIIEDLHNKSKVFLRHTKTPATSEMVFINIPNGEGLHDGDRFTKPVQPILSPYKAIDVQMEELNLSDITG
ncbi:MAG: C1 family peptidase [Tannerella sp.]|jgi:C1A family cysteine protease|nr:C1 family peptidase [Tannerella sp.]